MAFKNGLSERLDELRFPSPRSPPTESAFPGYSSLSPGHSNFVSAFSRPSSDVRANLQRRFTTDSSKFSSSWNYMSQGPSQLPELPDPLDLLSSVSIVFPCSLSCTCIRFLHRIQMQSTGAVAVMNLEEFRSFMPGDRRACEWALILHLSHAALKSLGIHCAVLWPHLTPRLHLSTLASPSFGRCPRPALNKTRIHSRLLLLLMLRGNK